MAEEQKILSLVERRPPVKDDWTPVTMLEEFLQELRDGKVKPTKMVIQYFEETPEGGLMPRSWTMNMTHSEEIALAVVMQDNALARWRGREA